MPQADITKSFLTQKSKSSSKVNVADTTQPKAMQPAAAAPGLSKQEANIFEALCECTAGIGQYRQFIFYVGTSCDSQKLRIQISLLQEKLFENIVYQKESIIEFLKRTLSAKSTDSVESDRIERLICYTLTTLNCLETLVNQFSYLSISFPLNVVTKKETTVDLGSDETTYGSQLILDNQKFFDTHLKQNHASSSVDLKSAQNADTSKSLGYHAQFNEENELKSRLGIIRRLREEIEQIDTNLVRYNVKCESDEFVKFILHYSPDKDSMVFTKMDSNQKKAPPGKDKAKPTSPTPAATTAKAAPASAAAPARSLATNGGTTAPTVASVPKTTTLTSNWNKRKLILFLGIIIVSILIIVALVCGLVFGLQKK